MYCNRQRRIFSNNMAAADLCNIATSAQTALTTLWQDAGVPEEEQQTVLASMVADVRALVDAAMKEQQEKVETIRAELPSLRMDLEALRELGLDVRAVPSDDSSLPIVPQRAALDAALSAATALKAERLEQRRVREEQLEAARAELDGEDGPNADDEARRSSIVPDATAAGGLSLATLGRLQVKIDGFADEKAARLAKLKELKERAASLRMMLGYPAESSDTSSVTRKAITAAEKVIHDYEAEVERRQGVLADCIEYIEHLRSKLSIPESEWVVLPKEEDGKYSQDVLEAYHVEMERLEAQKTATLAPRLLDARRRVHALWPQLHMSDAQTHAFAAAWPAPPAEGAPAAADDEIDAESLEDLLDAVEAEEGRLQAKLTVCTDLKVFEKLGRRAEILGERDEMYASQSDPSRLLNKRDGGRLLREEKTRKAVEKELPSLNRQLRKLVQIWDSEHAPKLYPKAPAEALTYDGIAIVELVDKQEQEDEERKGKKREPVAPAPPPAAARPSGAGATSKAPTAKGPSAASGAKAKSSVGGPATAKAGAKSAPKGGSAIPAAPKKEVANEPRVGAGARQAVSAAAAAALMQPPPPPPERDLGADDGVPMSPPKHAVPTERVLKTLSMGSAHTPSLEPSPAKGALISPAVDEENAPLPIA